MKNLSKLAALISGIVLVFSVFLYCPPVAAQTVQQGTLLLSADTDCVVVFDGDTLGAFSTNTVRKIKADFGDHIVMATFAGNNLFKKTITVKNTVQMVIKLTPPIAHSARQPISNKSTVITKKDSLSLTKEAATELYKAELLLPSPVDISKLKYYLSKGVDVQTTDKNGWSLLHEAAFQGDTDLILFCLKNGLPVDGKSIHKKTFSTPLSTAIKENKYDAIKVLLRHNATYGIVDGYGEVEYDSSNRYKGNFKNGKKDGLGTFYYANGAKYEGNWGNDKENGKGTYTWEEVGKYEGDWSDGLQSGYGEMTFAEGTYKGHFEKGKISGQGVLFFANGNRYSGNFSDNSANGNGTMYYKDSGRYEGNWSGNKRNGQGTCYYANGNKYAGNWENDKKNGAGILFYISGDKYEGNWSNDKMNGQGVYYLASGAKYVGNYSYNQKSGQGIYYWSNGDKYDGQWISNQRTGKGTYSWTNGDKYEGESLNGVKQGYGVYTIAASNPNSVNNCPRCKTYKGYWDHDVKHGDGGCYDAAGNLIFEGRFVNDAPEAGYPVR